MVIEMWLAQLAQEINCMPESRDGDVTENRRPIAGGNQFYDTSLTTFPQNPFETDLWYLYENLNNSEYYQ